MSKSDLEVAGQVVKNGREIWVLGEDLQAFHFESKSYEYDLGKVTSWYKELTGIDNGQFFDKLHADLQGVWGVKLVAQSYGGKHVLGQEEATDRILEEFKFKTFNDTEEVLLYREGIFVPGGEAAIKGWLERNVEACTTRLVQEVIGHVQRRTFCKREDFDQDPRVLNLKNGLLDLGTYEFKSHSHDHLSLIQLPVKFDPGVDCPTIKKFLSEIVYQEDIELIQEYIGYCLWRDYPSAKVLLLTGDGENGKSTFINVIKALVGRQNISSRGLQELETNRFAKADFHAKLANLYADLPDTALKSTGIFKMLTGGDPITAEHKFRGPFNFTNHAKLIFSANKVPEVFEDTTGFFRRWLIVTFPNAFSGSKADKDLLSKLTTDEELSGFLNWVIEGLKRLRQNSWNFSNAKSTDLVKEEYIRKSSPIRAFLLDCSEVRSDGFVSKKDVFEAFATYCRERKLPAVTDQTFFRNLPVFASIKESKPTIEGKRIAGYTGLSVRPQSEWGDNKVGGTPDSPANHTTGSSNNFGSHSCAVCQKEGARAIVREKGVVYLHPGCEFSWEGPL
jgi:P4 family phage/plasmid primase-like protien